MDTQTNAFLEFSSVQFPIVSGHGGGMSEKGRRSFRKILSKYVNSKQSKTDKGSRGDRIGASGPPGLSAILIFSAFLLSGKVEK